MSCNLVQGNEVQCRDSVGGIKEVYIANFSNVLSATATSGQVSAITMAGSTKFYTFQLRQEDGSYTNPAISSRENGTTYYDSTVTFTIKKMSASQKNSLHNLAKSRLMVIVKDNNDVFWIVGRVRGCDALDIQNGTGQALGDLNGATITISGREAEPDAEFTGTISSVTS